MQNDLERILVTRERIQARVAELGAQIAADYREQELVIMPLLTGSIIFVADLVRHLPLKMRIDIAAISSYAGATTSQHAPRVLYPQKFDLTGRHVLVVDDILDTGRTLRSLLDTLRPLEPASLRTCVLLRKQIATGHGLSADYIGFDIPDEFVVGYGLDYAHYYRNLPDIAVLRAEVAKK